MKRIEVSFAELQKGDTVVRRTRTGQAPSVVSEVFTLKTGEKAFRTEDCDINVGVYYKEAKFVMAYREGEQINVDKCVISDKLAEIERLIKEVKEML